jgi:hypothetical protein
MDVTLKSLTATPYTPVLLSHNLLGILKFGITYATVRRQIFQELAVSERRVRKDIEAYPVILAIADGRK